MVQLRLTVDTGDTRRDVGVRVPSGTTLQQVSGLLGRAADIDGQPTWWAGRRPLPAAAIVGGPGLRHGDVLTAMRPAGSPIPSHPIGTHGLLHLAVVAGPDSGRILPLERGVHVIGRAGDCDLVLTDHDVSRRHAVVTMTSTGASLRDLRSTNGTRTDVGAVDSDGCDLAADQAFEIGDTMIRLRSRPEPRGVVRATPDGRLAVIRSARDVDAPVTTPPLLTPPDPSSDRRPRIAWIAALLPAVAGIGFAWAMHTWQFLAFAALSPLTVIGTAAGDRWSWRRSRRRSARDYRQSVDAHERQIADGLTAEAVQRHDSAPDPASVAAIAAAPSARLWPWRTAPSFPFRVGSADCKSVLRISGADGDEPAGVLRQVPLCADLAVGAIGIAGPPECVVAIARAGVCGAAVRWSPADLEIVLLLSDGCDSDWSWLRWLPHTVTHATNPVDRGAAVDRLLQRCRNASRPGSTVAGSAWTLVVADRVGVLSEDTGFAEVISLGSQAGIVAVCIDETPVALPAACAAVATVNPVQPSRLLLNGLGWSPDGGAADACGAVIADQVSADWAEQVARSLAPLVDPTGGGGDDLPSEVRLVDLLPPPVPVVRGSAAPRRDVPAVPALGGGQHAPTVPDELRPLRTPIGVGPNGTVALDLSADGPHALVAGTTGSGKSELLQSWITGLALSFAPDDLRFLLVDYKGGAAFGGAAAFPHVAGVVTDLNTQLTQRVLRSLDAEIRSREHRLADASVPDLGAHRLAGSPGGRLPRLVVVVDEFATLAAELPAFVPGLVDVAQRGRSLGVHLVLATQRPGHVVSPAIRANTSLRIALRVSEPGESIDIIGVPDAAATSASRPGRAIVRTAEGLTIVQTGRVTTSADRGPALWVRPVGLWDGIDTHPADGNGPSDLDRASARAQSDWQDRLAAGCATEPKPIWHPALPDLVSSAMWSGRPDLTRLVVGRRDRPHQQEQCDEAWDLEGGGATVIVGAARSGRTTALRTVIGSALERGVPVATIDAAGEFDPIATSAGVVAHVSASDHERLARIVELLEAEVEARRRRIGAHEGGPLLVVVDDADVVLSRLDETDVGRGTDRLLRLMRSAASTSIRVVVAGDRTLLAPRVVASAESVFLLRLADRGDYAMAGIAARDVPDHVPPGRALDAANGEQIQFAVIGGRPEAEHQWSFLRSADDGWATAAARRSSRQPGNPPGAGDLLTSLAVRPLPVQVDFDTVIGRDVDPPHGTTTSAPGNPLVAIGVGGDLAERVGVDLWAGVGRFLIAGPPRSGRSTTLTTIAASTVAIGGHVWWGARAQSPLWLWGTTAASGSALTRDTSSLPVLGDRRVVVLLDDVDELADCPLSEALTEAVRTVPPDRLAIVVAGRADELLLAYRGISAEVRRARRGVLLNPGPGDGELLGVRTTRGSGLPPGRGVLVADGVVIGGRTVAAGPVTVQIASPPSFAPAVKTEMLPSAAVLSRAAPSPIGGDYRGNRS